MVFPAIETRAFPGNREEAYRAGIPPRIRCGTIDSSIVDGGRITGAPADSSPPRPCYTGARLRDSMRRSLLALGLTTPLLVTLALLAANDDRKDDKKPDPQQ